MSRAVSTALCVALLVVSTPVGEARSEPSNQGPRPQARTAVGAQLDVGAAIDGFTGAALRTELWAEVLFGSLISVYARLPLSSAVGGHLDRSSLSHVEAGTAVSILESGVVLASDFVCAGLGVLGIGVALNTPWLRPRIGVSAPLAFLVYPGAVNVHIAVDVVGLD